MRRNSMRRKLNLVAVDATKNMVSLDTTIATLTVVVVQLAIGVNPGVIDSASTLNYVEEAAMIKGFNISYRVLNRSGNLPGQEKVVIFLRKNEGNVLPAPTLAQCNAIGGQAWKNRVFSFQQAKPGAPGDVGMFQAGIRIPKRFHRTSKGDVWELIIANNGSGSVDGCGTAIYKWYR